MTLSTDQIQKAQGILVEHLSQSIDLDAAEGDLLVDLIPIRQYKKGSFLGPFLFITSKC